jgi:hypothetical protein
MGAIMDDWHGKVARELVARTPSGGLDPHAGALEIAFGDVRAAIAFVLEIARAHRIAATGSIVGDDLWIQLGEARARFTLNRRESRVIVRTQGDEQRLHWDPAKNGMVDGTDAPADLEAVARATLDTVIDQWRSSPTIELLSIVPPQPDLEQDDEPTKG